IVCTPDGSCIVALVEENISNTSDENVLGEDISHESNEQDNESEISTSDTASNSDTEDSADESTGAHESVVKRAYIYFCSGFGRPASK
ncbi:1940_t:CDS:1, partial [Racocetra fulgida]